jgi:hypothetical protein
MVVIVIAELSCKGWVALELIDEPNIESPFKINIVWVFSIRFGFLSIRDSSDWHR